jgi:hypothetical protein
MKWKEHTNAVCEEGEKIITAEVVNKPHFKLRDPIAYDVCINVLDPISRAWDSTALTGQGRSAYELSELVNTVEWPRRGRASRRGTCPRFPRRKGSARRRFRLLDAKRKPYAKR